MKWKMDSDLIQMFEQGTMGPDGSTDDTHPVLIRTRSGCQANHLSDLCSMTDADQTSFSMPTVGMFSGRLCRETIQSLNVHPDVHYIYLDRPIKAMLDIAVPAVGAATIRQEYGLTGKGVTIAVLDTGVYPHPDLTRPANRIIGFKDFIQGRTDPYDDNGHGTHAAGDAAGNGFLSNGRYAGPATQANVLGVKVLDADGNGSISTIIAGIDYCIQNKQTYNIRIINLSLGADPYTSYADDPLAHAARTAWRQGIVVCAAAGNSGPSGPISTPGFDPLLITVGASNDYNTVTPSDDTYPSYSSRGPTVNGFLKPDLVAPGTNIVSLLAPGSTLANQFPNNQVEGSYFTLSGTSMATPICAGVCAQIIQAYPTFSPDQVKVLIKETAQFLQAGVPGFLLATRAIWLTLQ